MEDQKVMEMIENLTEELGEKEDKIMKQEKIIDNLDKENKKNFLDNHIYSRLGKYIFDGYNPWDVVFVDFTIDCDNILNSYEEKIRAIELFTIHQDQFNYPYNYGHLTRIQTEEEVMEMIKMNKGEESDSDEDEDEEPTFDEILGDFDYYEMDFMEHLPFKNKNGDNIYMVIWSL